MIATIDDSRGVAATITTSAAAATRWEVVVVGAGPAGAATALRLARGGRKVVLVDRDGMPRPKVCGCCLSTRARDELRSLLPGPADRSIVGEVPLDAVRLVAAGRAVRLPLPAGGVVSRESLDAALVRAAIAAGADWLPHVTVAGITEPTAAGAPLVVAGRTATRDCRLTAAHVVIAAGLADHVRVPDATNVRAARPGSRMGVGCVLDDDAGDLAAGELVMAVGRSGYCGIVRLEDGRIDVAAAVDRRAVAAADGPAGAVAAILREAGADRAGVGFASAALAAAICRATPPLTRAAPLVAGATRRIFRVGDAAGYVEPFTGEGMGWALAGARLVSDAVLDAADPAAAYASAHAACFAPLHGRCRRVAAALRQPALVAAAIGAARVWPWAARRAVPFVVGAAAAAPR